LTAAEKTTPKPMEKQVVGGVGGQERCVCATVASVATVERRPQFPWPSKNSSNYIFNK